MPNAYLTRQSLAAELQIGESTVDDMVKRGVLPPPARLSAGCVRWRWETVDRALNSMIGGGSPAPEIDIQARVQRAIQATKDRGRGRAA